MFLAFPQFRAMATKGIITDFFKLNNKKTANKILITKRNGKINPKYANHTSLAGLTNVAKKDNSNKPAKKIAKLLNKIHTKLLFFFDLNPCIACKVTKKIVILQIK